jgi:hypothetical protein
MPGARHLTPAKLAAIVALLAVFSWYVFRVLQPPLPITVKFRSEMGGSGFVLIFENESDHALSFGATLGHAGHREEKKLAIQVPPRSSYDVGSSQGWVGQSGDRISLTSSDYRVWTGAIP